VKLPVLVSDRVPAVLELTTGFENRFYKPV